MRHGLFVVSLLVSASFVHAQDFDMPKGAWLSNLKPMMSDGLCNGANSPFTKIYKGTPMQCVPEVQKLFDFCAEKESTVVLPEKITSIPQANWYGQVMAECVSAYYQGDAAIKGFHIVQETCKTSMVNGEFKGWCPKPNIPNKL